VLTDARSSPVSRIVVAPDYLPEPKGCVTGQAQILLDQKQISRMLERDKQLLRKPVAPARLLAK